MRLLQDLKTNSRILILAMLLLGWPLLFLNSCAGHVKQVPTQIEPASIIKSSFVLVKEMNYFLYSRSQLKSGTKWDFVNTITQGDVFKSKDQIVTLEATNIFEVYIVISSNKLVGFYLPVEKTFSPLDDSRELEKREMKSN